MIFQAMHLVTLITGHCLQPVFAGMEGFPGLQMHCHNYRHADAFRDKRVLVVGASFSGMQPTPSSPFHAPVGLSSPPAACWLN